MQFSPQLFRVDLVEFVGVAAAYEETELLIEQNGFLCAKTITSLFRSAVIIISHVGGDASAWYLDKKTSRTEPRSQPRHESCSVQQQIRHVGSAA